MRSGEVPVLPNVHLVNNAIRPRTLWLLGTALALFASHSNWDVPLAAWLFPVFLLRYTRSRPVRAGLPRVWCALLIASVVWLASTGLIFVLEAWLIFLVLVCLKTGAFLLDRVLAPKIGSGLLATLVFPVAVVAAELLVAVVVDFGNYGALGSTQHGFLPLVQISSVTAVYGVSFLVAWFASVVNWAWGRGFTGRQVRRTVLTYTAVLAAVLAAGGVRLLFFAPTTDTVRVAAFSPSATASGASRDALEALGVKYWRAAEVVAADPGQVRAAFAPVVDDLVERTRLETEAGAKIVVWPETQARVLERDQADLMARVGEIARRHQAYVNTAFALYTSRAPHVRNISSLVTPDGRVAWTYDKAHPTPMEPMTPGPEDVPVADSPFGTLASVICYDADFPELMRQAATKGADLVLVPANDWAGYENLHAEMAVFRAVENGYSMVRQSSHGVSTAVDPQGRVLGQTDFFRTDRQTLVAEVPVQQRSNTVYSRFGDAFGWLCVLATAGLVVLAVQRRSSTIPAS